MVDMALETILLAVGPGDADRTEALARAVADVAQPADATVVLAHVFTDDEYEAVRSRLEFDDGVEVEPDRVAKRHETIRDLAAAFDDDGLEYTVRGAVGDHGTTVVDLADDVEADRVVVGGRRRSPTGKAVFGSTAQTVLLNAPCPTTFVRGEV